MQLPVEAFARFRGRTALSVCMVLLVTGCAGPARRDTPALQWTDALPAGFPATVRIVDESSLVFQSRASQVLQRLHDTAGREPISVLALSGGGVGAAFGAGALVGWTRAGNRPDFHIVTGVSAGALIAPFAFLGPDWDDRLEDAFSGRHNQRLLRTDWLGAMFGSSAYQGEPLLRFVDRYVTADLLRAVAARASTGRLLLVATTDLDRLQTVIWNLGVVAAQGGDAARRLFRDVIVASSSIPGVFPPVLIRVKSGQREFDEMHVDGGTTSALFIAPEIASLLPIENNVLKNANVYIVVNGQLGAKARTTAPRILTIVKRSLTAVFQSSSRAAVEIALSLAQRNGMSLKVTEIPNDYPYRGPLDESASRMKLLFDFGVGCALRQQLWATPLQLVDRKAGGDIGWTEAHASCPAAAANGLAN
jgi:hypothetical protein